MPISDYLRIINPTEPCTDMPPTLAYEYKFPLDNFQQHAIAAISRAENVLVTAKTGSGKTLVGEYQIAHSLKKGGRVFYTTPIKSLSNQKFYDLKQMFPGRVGIMTGDIKFRPDAEIIIMTTEILRNLLYKQGSKNESIGITADLTIQGLDAVVFDECHYINDKDRGSVWEETMILLPPHVNLVMLSATIDAPEHFAGWLGDLKKKPIHLISTQYRIVPLVHGVYKGEEFLPIMDNKEVFNTGNYREWLNWYKAQEEAKDVHKQQVANRRHGGYEDGPVKRAGSQKSFTHQMNALIGRLDAKTLLPALFFVFSRKSCERYAHLVEHTLITSSDTAAVRHIIDFHLHRYGEELQRLPQYNALRGLLEKGIAFHHSGVLPILKEIIEILFGRGLIKVLFATETFAVGINMPTKTVVFTGFRKYDDGCQGMRQLNTDEYIQMAGRAGRRGKDDKGIVIYLPEGEPEQIDDVKRMLTGSRATFQSRMKFHYEFILKTFQGSNTDWIQLMKQSYWARRNEKNIATSSRDLEMATMELGQISLTSQEIDDIKQLEELQARVKESTNAARRDAQRLLEGWKQKHVGPRWYLVEKELWTKWKGAQKRIELLKGELAALNEPQRDVYPVIENLERMGFLKEGALTHLGQMGAEVNEGHCILMPLYYLSGAKLTTPQDVLSVLAVFLGESDENAQSLDSLQIAPQIRTAFKEIWGIAEKCYNSEQRIYSNDSYWKLDFTWVEPIARWIQGATLPEITADYGIFEGNFIRAISKLANILEEWRSLALINEHLDVLDMLRDADQLVKVGIASSESLYLRL